MSRAHVLVQDKEIEIMPRLQKLICKINKPDADDESLVDAPVCPTDLLFYILVRSSMCKLCSPLQDWHMDLAYKQCF